MKPAVDEMFPEGAGPYVDLDEVGGGGAERCVGDGSTPANLRGSPGLWGFRNCQRLGKWELPGTVAGPGTVYVNCSEEVELAVVLINLPEREGPSEAYALTGLQPPIPERRARDGVWRLCALGWDSVISCRHSSRAILCF